MWRLNLRVSWADVWRGGFCPVGALGGLPVRGADYAAHLPLEMLLTLPEKTAVTAQVTLEAAERAWSEQLGGVPVLLLRDDYRVRRLLHQAAKVTRGEGIGLPANGSHNLTESIKHHGAQPCFLDFDANLQLEAPVQHG